MSGYMSHGAFAARDRAACEDDTRRTGRYHTPFDAKGCTGTLRFVWMDRAFNLAVCDECGFEIAVLRDR